MAEILDHYSNNSSMGKDRASNGGKQSPKPLSYDSPKGPKGQSHEGPGLGESNCGNCGTQGRY